MKGIGEICLYDNKAISQELTEIFINNQPINVLFPQLQNMIKYLKKYNSKEEFQQKFPKKYEKVQQNLNISENGSELFLKLISGNLIKLNIENSFDLYKFSTFFEISSILEQIKTYWQISDQIEHINDFISNLLKFDKSIKNSEQREYLDHFIDEIEIPKQFSSFIKDFFEDFSTQFLIHLLEKCDKKSIPNDVLFDYISKNIEENIIFLSFLDFQKLSATKKNEFLLFVFDQYCQLLNSNADYLGKIKTEDPSESLGYLINASKHGNLAASYELCKLYKDDPKQKKNYEFYLKNYRSQKELTQFFQKNREIILKQTININSDETNLKKDPNDLQSSINDNNNDSDNVYDSGSSCPTDDDDDDDDDDEYNFYDQKDTEKPQTVIDTNNAKSYKKDDDTIPKLSSSYQHYKNTQDKHPYRYKSDEKPRKGYRKRRTFTQTELRNQEIWKETDKIVKTGKYTILGKLYDIKKKVDDCIKNTELINKNVKFDDEFSKLIKDKKPGAKEKKEICSRILIWPESTFNAAKRIKVEFSIREVCVLNFASATKPGGGVINGRKAQEETLSRQSSLYHSISPQTEFYEYHKKNTSPFYTHYMIYSPNVVVFRDDDYNLINYYRVSVITSAAVNYNLLYKIHPLGSRDDDIRLCMKNRCRKILQIAIKNNNKAIVLGAFGCGVFGNKPEVISKIFKEIIVDEYYGMFFQKIVFAIKGKPGVLNNNLKAFQKTFPQK